MTLTRHGDLTGLVLSGGMAVCANPAGPACLYSDVVTHRANAAPIPHFERYQRGELAQPEAVTAVDLDFSRRPDRLDELLIAALTSGWERDRALELAPHSGLLVLAPDPLTTHQLGLLGLDRSPAAIHAVDLATGLDRWQQALRAHPEIDRWYWLALDSRCAMDWLLEQPLLYAADTHPDGALAGEALVLTEWRRNDESGVELAFAGYAEEPNGATAVQASVSARRDLLIEAEPEIARRAPDWAECLTNDDLTPDRAAERYKTEVALWPEHEADPALGPAEPFLSWYAMTGDVGLAALPLGLLLARHRLDHPLRRRDEVGVMINSGAERHYWRLRRPEARLDTGTD